MLLVCLIKEVQTLFTSEKNYGKYHDDLTLNTPKHPNTMASSDYDILTDEDLTLLDEEEHTFSINEVCPQNDISRVPPQSHNHEASLSTTRLLSMTPFFQEIDIVRIAARHLFLSKVKSQSCVKDVFYRDHTKDAYEYMVEENWFDFETFSVLYTCQAISKCLDPYNLHSIIDGNKCDQHLEEIATSPDWKKLGFALYSILFPDLVKDSESFTPFKMYLQGDRKYWGRELYEKVRDSQWLYSLIRPVVTGECSDIDYNRDINILFVKLHLLDPTLVMPAYHYLQKALPDLRLELATTNYLGPPLDWRLIQRDVEAVLYKPLFPRRVSRVCLQQVDVYYGVEILDFVMKEPRELELLTDSLPDNRRISTFKDRCMVM